MSKPPAPGQNMRKEQICVACCSSIVRDRSQHRRGSAAAAFPRPRPGIRPLNEVYSVREDALEAPAPESLFTA